MNLPEWKQNKTAIIKKVNKPLLNQPLSQFIEEKAKPLDEKIMLVNEAIRSKENTYMKLNQTKDGSII